MRDILSITQKHIYILFHNNHFQSKNAAWPIIENTPLVPHLKKNLFPRGTGPFRFLPIPMGGNITCGFLILLHLPSKDSHKGFSDKDISEATLFLFFACLVSMFHFLCRIR